MLNETDKTQRTMICVWLIEVFLKEINDKRDANELNQAEQLQQDLYKFFDRAKDLMAQSHAAQETVYDLISSHGRTDDLAKFAMTIRDYERVIEHHIQQGQYTEALRLLRGQEDLELYYKFALPLFQHAPDATVTAWKSRPDLNPRRFIPLLVRTDGIAKDASGELINYAVQYLEFCVNQGNRDPVIHNYLLSQYAKMSDESMLMQFLRKYGDAPVYDVKYALRVCMQEGRKRACVAIYGAMKLYEEAVELALEIDIELAKTYADEPELDDSMRRKLWLLIARHVVEKERDIKKCAGVATRAIGGL